MKKFGWITSYCILMIGLASQPLLGQPLQSKATDVIEKLNAALVESMKNGDELGFSGHYRLLEPVIKNSFDFPYIVRKVTGKYWKDMDENQRKILLKNYTAWTVAKYAQRFHRYKGQKFEVVSESEFRPRVMKVKSNLIKANKEIIELIYFLLENKGSWRIVDIHVSGVSQLAINRTQFKQVLKDKGFDGLNTGLKEKIKELSAIEKTDFSSDTYGEPTL
ncbi:MAG: ABC transporter substrate-binding protein [Deltaproteobacteria bacterium]|nr:ABC transporter substrate-binding protein [Deltaproteobacteria bacterium]